MSNTIVGKRLERKINSDLTGLVSSFLINEPPAWKQFFNDKFREMHDGSIKDDEFYKEIYSLIDGTEFWSSNAASTPTPIVWEYRMSITPKNIAVIMNKGLPVVLGTSGNERWNLVSFTPDAKKAALKNPVNNKRKTVVLKEGKFVLALKYNREPRHFENIESAMESEMRVFRSCR